MRRIAKFEKVSMEQFKADWTDGEYRGNIQLCKAAVARDCGQRRI